MLRSSVEAAYVVYMINYFKTTKNFSKGSVVEGFAHPVGDSTQPTSFICPFGNKISWVFATYLVGRNLFKKDIQINKLFLLVGMGFSMLNANVFVYMFPVFATEFYYLL